MGESLGDDIRESVHAATEGIRESIEAAMEDMKEAMGDLGLGDRGIGGAEEFDFGEVDESARADTVEQQFEVGDSPSLSVVNVSGEVTITAGDTSVIKIRAGKHGSRRRMASTDVQITREGDRVTAETRAGQRGTWNLGRNVSRVDYDIIVPRGCRVFVKTVSADVRTSGTGAPVEIETVSGDVNVDDAAGESKLTTISGDVRIRRLIGSLMARTTSGDLTVDDSQLRRFHLNSVSGDFRLDTPLTANEHYYAKTVSGDLLLSVPENTGAIVQLKTVSGDVQTDLPAEIIKSGRRNWQGRINGGGANVEMQSVSGDLHIALSRRSETAVGLPFPPPAPAQAPPVPEPPPTDQPSTTDILRALEVGEITVEEALARLEALR